jgi:hypothetical protein
MTSGTEPLEFGLAILHRTSACVQNKVTQHRQRGLVETEEECGYEAFVTDPLYVRALK